MFTIFLRKKNILWFIFLTYKHSAQNNYFKYWHDQYNFRQKNVKLKRENKIELTKQKCVVLKIQ